MAPTLFYIRRRVRCQVGRCERDCALHTVGIYTDKGIYLKEVKYETVELPRGYTKPFFFCYRRKFSATRGMTLEFTTVSLKGGVGGRCKEIVWNDCLIQ